MKTEERSRHTVWMEDTVWQRVQEHYKSDGCSTQNEFIAKAILFYCGYLQSEYAGDFLPKILGETVGVDSLMIVVAITVSGRLWGLVGMFIGVPLFAVLRQAVKELVESRLQKKHLPTETTAYMDKQREAAE